MVSQKLDHSKISHKILPSSEDHSKVVQVGSKYPQPFTMWNGLGSAPHTAETPAAETGGTYVSLGSYSIISVPGNPNLAPTAWRLEGVEPYTETRQTLDEAIRPWMDGWIRMVWGFGNVDPKATCFW